MTGAIGFLVLASATWLGMFVAAGVISMRDAAAEDAEQAYRRRRAEPDTEPWPAPR